MTILALEFSSEQRSVAVKRGNSVSEAIETGGRSTAAFGMIEKVLAEAKIEREEIGTIAVGLGPGSYTGVRAAIAMAQGWQLAREVKLLGISSAEAIAAQSQMEKISGRVNVVINAQRGEFYLASYEITETALKEIAPLRILSLEQVPSRTHEAFIGPEATKWFAAGKIVFPRATAIAKLAAGRDNFEAGESLQPIYLREANFVKAPRPKAII